MKTYGIPYKGSKNKICSEIVEFILKENPKEIAPYKILKPAVEAISQVVEKRLKLFNFID
jgi:fructose/tagatose bisphosphate aldolase